jgi:hypothetical protein
MYRLTCRRELETTGGGCAYVNSRDLSTVIPRDHLPERVVKVEWPKPRKGSLKPTEPKVTRGPVNAEEFLVGRARRAQMRGVAHIETGAKAIREKDGHDKACGYSAMVGGGLY